MRRILVTAAAIAALAVPCSAYATPTDPPEKLGWLPKAEAIARYFWESRGYTKCAGLNIRVFWHTPGSLGGHMANAYVNGCERGLAYTNVSVAITERGWMSKCGTLVHEHGHLVGLTHDAPFAVMRRADRPPECAHPQLARKRAAEHRWRSLNLRAAWRREKSRRLAVRYERAAVINCSLFYEQGTNRC